MLAWGSVEESKEMRIPGLRGWFSGVRIVQDVVYRIERGFWVTTGPAEM